MKSGLNTYRKVLCAKLRHRRLPQVIARMKRFVSTTELEDTLAYLWLSCIGIALAYIVIGFVKTITLGQGNIILK